MYKQKTNSAAKKRFRKAGSKGKVRIKRGKAFRRHLMTKKGPKRRRQLRAKTYVGDVNMPAILRLLPY
jgi:large subunit ribosomal protein L35